MRSFLVGSLIAALAVPAGPAAGGRPPVSPPDSIDPAHVPGFFVAVSFPPQALGTETLLDHLVIERPPDGDPVAQAADLSLELGFEVEPMVMYQLADEPSSEPLFGEQWNLENRGQTGGLPDADIDAAAAWHWTRGVGAVVAVVDSGVEASHPDLTDRLWINGDEIPGNGIDDDLNGYVDDVRGWDFRADDADPTDTVGHGTAVGSVAVAAANGIGMAGVAPAATLMPIRACDGLGCPASAVAAGIVYSVDNGADIVNLSLGAPGTEPLVTAAVAYAAERDVLVVAAAGNAGLRLDSDTPWTPASVDAPNLLAVAATSDSDQLLASSNYGPEVVDLAAPGGGILVASLGGAYETRSGTSFAAPHVAGVAALMRALDERWSAGETAELLRTQSHPLEALVGLVQSGGRLDARRATVAARFRDMPGSAFADDAMWAATRGITFGCGPARFCPDTVVTRGQMAAFLRRAGNLPTVGTNDFVDDDRSIFEADIDAIAAAGITEGCTEDRFCPEDPVTRGQMAAFLVRAYDLPPGTRDAFEDDEGSVFEQDIDALAAARVTFGCNPPAGTSFCPEAQVTRGQMVALIRRTLS